MMGEITCWWEEGQYLCRAKDRRGSCKSLCLAASGKEFPSPDYTVLLIRLIRLMLAN
jgi:hypothetical protein